MNILLTGATGYIGKRLLPILIRNGHFVYCCVRDRKRFSIPKSFEKNIKVIEVDFLNPDSLKSIPKEIDAAYYLMHSMSGAKNYQKLELQSAQNFVNQLKLTKIQHVIYLSGIVNQDKLSEHLTSRKAVEIELTKGKYHFTTLRAGIIIGSGSASYEIIRDLVEKLPIMITPKWLNTKCQPISIGDVIKFLSSSLLNELVYDKSFDIGGPDVLSYKEMLLGYAKARKLKRLIYTIPVMTPKLSSYWLYFITSTSYKLASALVNSMKIEVVCSNNDINKLLKISPVTYSKAIHNTLSEIDNNQIISSWKDSFISGDLNFNISEFIEVPKFGCYKDQRIKQVKNVHSTISKIWSIGGQTGWYYANFLWKIRGFLDLTVGGVGLRRGRTHPDLISTGDSIDFWRVLFANKKEGRLLLFAEMKLPGEAWLEFKIINNKLLQTATFRPKGLFGRLYWIAVLPLHGIVFRGLIKKLAS